MYARKSYDFFKKTRIDLNDFDRAFNKALNEPKLKKKFKLGSESKIYQFFFALDHFKMIPQ